MQSGRRKNLIGLPNLGWTRNGAPARRVIAISATDALHQAVREAATARGVTVSRFASEALAAASARDLAYGASQDE